MDFVRRAELVFWAFVAFIVALTASIIILDRGYIWPLINIGDWLLYAGMMLMIFGYAVRRYAIATLGRAFSNILKIKQGQTLIRSGIYAKVRHPAYTGTLVMVAGIPLLFSSPIGLLPVSLALPAVLYRISVEEKMLKQKFGQEYQDYIASTKMLVPHLI
jgi:protein-S-isoprenylcysteine O-methyltransferase Ste14